MRFIESELQQACVRWFNYQYPALAPLLFAVPNGGKRNVREAARLKAEGVRAGVTDLILLVPRNGFASLCIELKTDRGRLTDNQKRWQQSASGENNKVVVCRGIDEFIKEVKDYLRF